MSNWRPTECSICGGKYVNRPSYAAVQFLAMILIFCVFGFLAAYADLDYLLAAVGIILSLSLVFTFLTCPMPIEDLQMYTKRRWWEYPLVYIAIPLGIVAIGVVLVLWLSPVE